MDCFDVSLGLHAMVGTTMVVAGSSLMLNLNSVSRGLGAFCFALGYYILGLAASGNDLGAYDPQNTRFLIGLGSALAVVIGTFMLYYHVQDYISKKLKGSVVEGLLKTIPLIVHLLIYGGLAGLVTSISMREDGSFNMTKLALSGVAVLTIGFTKMSMLNSIGEVQSFQKNQLTHSLSWLLLIGSIAFTC